MRVMCIYDEILKHIYACVTRRGKPPNPKQAALTKSWVWIGTYVPALSAAISLPLLSLADLELLAPGYVTKLWKNNNIPSAHDNCETSAGFPSAISKLLLTIVETIKTRPGGSIAGHEEYQDLGHQGEKIKVRAV
ncbi:hypothetical protein ACHAPF_005747 [Botrytis cinerea]